MITITRTSGIPASTTLATGRVHTWVGITRMTASPQGIREIWLPDWRTRTALSAQEESPTEPALIIETVGDAIAEQHLRQGLNQLAEYFAGSRQVFTLPLDPQGPPFFQRVWAEVARVPYGETRSYAEIAQLIGAPKATRAVGAANGANPVAPLIPCQRIVGSDGRLTGYGPGLPLKQRLLAMEDAIPASAADYLNWVERITRRFGPADWVLGLRRTQTYCAPLAAPEAQRLIPNRFFATAAEAEVAGYHPAH